MDFISLKYYSYKNNLRVLKIPVIHIAFIIVFCINSLFADQKTNPKDYSFRHIRIEDGLSQSSVYCMIQDKKGYLWFGTSNGLNRYDGYTFKVYSNNPADSTSISDNGIHTMLEDSKGYIWIGTVEGILNCFDRKKGEFSQVNITSNLKVEKNPYEKQIDYPLPYSRNYDRTITSIVEDKKGNLWIGTWGKGLIRYNLKSRKIQHFSYREGNKTGFNSNSVYDILMDSYGVLWIATLGDGLYRLIERDGVIETTQFLNDRNNQLSISSNMVTALSKDNYGNLWIGTYGNGLNKLSQTNLNASASNTKFMRYSNFSSSNFISGSIITKIQLDKKGRLWIGTFGSGLDVLSAETNELVNFKNNPNDENSLPKNEILSILEDYSGNLWIGTHIGIGLSRLTHKTEKFLNIKKDIRKRKGLNDDVVWSIYAENNYKVWIGTFKGGLNLWDRRSGSFSYYISERNNPGSISDNHIRAIADDYNGNLLIGTYAGGLNIFNKASKNSTCYKHNPVDSTSLGANQVQAIFKDRIGNYWIGTFGGGLSFLSKQDLNDGRIKFRTFKHNPNNPFSLSDNRVYCISEDDEGMLWVGTFGGGLNKFDRKSEKFISYKNIVGDNTSISDNRVMCVYQEKSGLLWIGTYGGGLQSFDKRKESFTRYSDKNRLKSSVVYGILQDKFNHLWMSTDNGLFKYDLPTKQFTQYDLHDGLQNLEFSGGAFCKSPNGEMFFGGINGFNYFYPDKIIDNSYVPPIVISSIKIFNEPLKEERDTIILSYDQNFFSFEFAALDFSNPQDNQYAYMLEGFDKQWRFVNSKLRIAGYTNLSPGKYVFSVIGSNNDGTWNYEGKNIFVIILAPYWQQWWFMALVVLFLAAVFYYIVTLRYRNLLAMEKLKSKLSSDLHDNIGSGLTEISILSELVGQEALNVSEPVSQKLKSVSEKARQLIDTMSDIVWMVNPQRDSFHDLIVRLKDSYSDLMTAAGISFKTINLEKLSPLKLQMEYKQNLFLILKEAINNSIKHSNCKRITFEANYNKDILELAIKDDGGGIKKAKYIAGNGIRNMETRAKLIGGEIKIDSTSEGTSIIFCGKIGGVNKILSLIKK